METRNIHDHAGWYASYMNAIDGGNDEQGQALVECQAKKIRQLTELVEKIKAEIELTEDPRAYNDAIVLQSIKALIDDTKEVEHAVGYFKWIG